MRKIILIFVLLTSLPSFSCELPKEKKLIIGCSYECSFSYRLRLKFAALMKGYSLEIVNYDSAKNVSTWLNEVDAVLIPGGADIHPEYYLDSVTPELAEYTRKNSHLVLYSSEGERRDPVEFEMLKLYSSEEKYAELPLLGICRGMQMMAVSHGVPLYLDLQTETGIKNRYYKFDKINVQQASSLMSSLFGRKKFRGFKLHHQGIRMPYFNYHHDDYPLLKVTATSHEGVIAEALEFTHRKALGVQYHPEKSSPRAARPIFDWFLTKACEYSQLKDRP